jgi:hypothetical protein
VPVVIRGKMRVKTVNWVASGHREKIDRWQHLTGYGVGRPFITYLCPVHVKRYLTGVRIFEDLRRKGIRYHRDKREG